MLQHNFGVWPYFWDIAGELWQKKERNNHHRIVSWEFKNHLFVSQIV